MGTPSTDKSAIRQIVTAIVESGYELKFVDNGGDWDENVEVSTVTEAVKEVCEVDEASLVVEGPSGERAFVYFVLGNSPEEVGADWSVSLDEVLRSVIRNW